MPAGPATDLRSVHQPNIDLDALLAELTKRLLQGLQNAPIAPTRGGCQPRPHAGRGSAPPAAKKPSSPPSAPPAPPAAKKPSTPPSTPSTPVTPGAPSAKFEPNAQAVETARNSALGKELQKGAERNAPIYREASEKTGVPASMIAAIHFNEGHMGKGVGPESGFGLDPRYVSTEKGSAILAKHGMGPWERGTGSELSQKQSAVIAADMLKTSAKAAGVEVGPNMSGHDASVAIHAYGTGSGSKSTKQAKETGRGFMFDPTDSQPHPRHPGGTSIGKDGEVIKVAPGVKNGLLRWDVALPLLDEKLGGTSVAKDAPAPAPKEAPAPTPASPPATVSGIPPRPADAISGSEFAKKIESMPPGPEREKVILEQVEQGNIPESARKMEPVTVRREGKDGKMHEITMNVAPDYIAIGSDADNVRIPMQPATAQKIADRMNATLPTTRMVDDIDAAATKRPHLDPIQWKEGGAHGRYMMSGSAAAEHDRRIDHQLEGQATGGIVSGHKKDIVIPADDGKVAIYGARYADGKRVQPYSNVHEAAYADYSHGARMVDRTVIVDGKPMDIRDVMADPNLAPLVSNRGAIARSSY